MKALLAIVMALTLSACNSKVGSDTTKQRPVANSLAADPYIRIDTDTSTGCRYIIANGSGVTPLLSSSGNPACYPLLGDSQ